MQAVGVEAGAEQAATLKKGGALAVLVSSDTATGWSAKVTAS